MQSCYLSRRAHAVHFGPPLQGGSSPPEYINHWRHCYLPTLMKFVDLADCKAIFLFLNQANLIWKPHGLINVGFHNIACTELLFRIELCFNCWELFHHGNLASAVRLLVIQPKIHKRRQSTLLREYQGADRFVFVRTILVSSLLFSPCKLSLYDEKHLSNNTN